MARVGGSQKHPYSHGMQDDKQVQAPLSGITILWHPRRGALQSREENLQPSASAHVGPAPRHTMLPCT